ncbi:deaminase [Parafrankia sp. EUN1f]|uniref:deoxycytidylate deaminase n=1 Tax=Parafrankia sp. EUN1f TaxID=102897 RepID=UPI0001C4599B|nr:deaminase [Parafrankia sp. EUN1f]EFC86482.1 CMP/dCMP deaminase zinc-binding [Parafrankia sp. EUN1f]
MPSPDRPDWDTYFLDIARAVAARGDCTRRQVGAVLVKGSRVRSTGYNGTAPGRPGCLAGACPRGRKTTVEVPAGSPYDDCIATHAEANALLYADGRQDTEGSTLYLTTEPCAWCQKLIRAAGVAQVVWPGCRIIAP